MAVWHPPHGTFFALLALFRDRFYWFRVHLVVFAMASLTHHFAWCSILGPTRSPWISPPIKSTMKMIAPKAQQVIKIQKPQRAGGAPFVFFRGIRILLMFDTLLLG